MFFVSENKNSLNGSIIQKKTNFTKDLDTHHFHTPAHHTIYILANSVHVIFCVVLKDDFLKKTWTHRTALHCYALTAWGLDGLLPTLHIAQKHSKEIELIE